MTNFADDAAALWMRAARPFLLQTRARAATAKALRSARIGTPPEWYLAVSYLAAIAVAALGAFAASLSLRYAHIEAPFRGFAIAYTLTVAAMLFLATRIALLAYPRVKSAARGKRIDAEFPSAMMLSYALARGGMSPLEIFRVMAEERKTYGEISTEFGVIVRNVEWMGDDLITALKDAASSTPSLTFKGFVEGLVSVLNSGADPKDYFQNQARTELANAELSLERDSEQTSLLAEIYVSGLLVLPLMLLVVMSGLAPLATEQSSLMPLVVYGLIPLGTFVYLILLEALVPPENVRAPESDAMPMRDFGLAASKDAAAPILPPRETMHDAPKAERKAWARLRRARAAHESKERFAKRMRRYLDHPWDVLEFSGFLGIAVGALGAYYLYAIRDPAAPGFGVVVTGIALAACAAAMLPVAIFHEIRTHRSRAMDAALPETLNKLAGFNDRGISLLQSFKILGGAATGPLAKEMSAMERDVSWNGSLVAALRRLRERVSTFRMTKLTVLLERASSATSNLRDVLWIAAEDETKRAHLRQTKRQSMLSYVIVVYIVFAVFLYVLYVVAGLFYGSQGLAANAGKTSLSGGLDPFAARSLFLEAVVIQGAFCGLVAGRLGEGHLLSGIKHAAFMSGGAYALFFFGVLS